MKKLIAISVLAFATGGAADAAKLCRIAPNSNAYNSASKEWAIGIGCGNAEKTGAVSSWCTNVQMSGVGICVDTPVWRSVYDVDDYINAAAGEYCFCRRTWPNIGFFAFAVRFNGQCNTSCVERCSYYARSSMTTVYLQ